MLNPMKTDEHHALTFTLGQIAAFQGLLQSDQDDNALGQGILAMRLLSRLWLQFCEDRPNLNLTSSLLSVESERNRPAFLACLHRLSAIRNRPRWKPLEDAIGLVVRAAGPPPPVFAAEIKERTTNDLALLDEFREPLVSDQIYPVEKSASDHIYPVNWLYQLVQDYAEIDIGSQHTEDRCWLLNLVLATEPELAGLSTTSIPFPGPLRRRSLRADIDPEERMIAVTSNLLSSAERLLSDLHSARQMAAAFRKQFADRRSTSRLDQGWILCGGLGTVTARQLARGLAISENAARNMLDTLVKARFLARNSPYFQVCLAYRLRRDLPGWAQWHPAARLDDII